ncbi:MAG TPA: heme-degrading domain-containing protein [Naasia sp.]|jgi:uncharacterized protein (UPF0303 family)
MTDPEGAGEPLSERIRRDEDELDFDRFGYDTAWQVGSWLVERARRESFPVAVSIVFGSQRVFHAALPGSSADNDRWLARKIATVTAYGASSLRVGAQFRERGADFQRDSTYDPASYAGHGGAVPIRVRGSLVGVAAVSGLAEDIDHALVVEALRAARNAAG